MERQYTLGWYGPRRYYTRSTLTLVEKRVKTIRAPEQRLYRGPKRVSRFESFAGGRLQKADAGMGRVTRGTFWYIGFPLKTYPRGQPGPH